VVVTGTASGKTLCFQLPILEATAEDPQATALLLYPTKALAQDQLKSLLDLLAHDDALARRAVPGVYDGDTPPAQRRRIKAEANLILSNPDMLHASLLPYHTKWARFFANLRFVVLDEVHQYRGILGANVACVVRRLRRIAEYYGARPVFLGASATIGNPGELFARLVGEGCQVVDNDGSPRGPKYIALWNPAALGADSLARRSAHDDATWWLTRVVQSGGQALAFAKTRQAAELIHRYTRELLQTQSTKLAQSVRAYRGGYLPNERREIEQALFSGSLRGVAATNALELGIDVGSLDVVLLAGYPGTIASFWQQVGRSGRQQSESLAVLIAANDAIDQYLLRHPEFLFSRSPEQAVVDPENPYVLTNHLRAAAFELPLDDLDRQRFGPISDPICGMLEETRHLTRVADKYYFAGDQNPASRISLRHMSEDTFSIVLRHSGSQRGRTAESIPTDHEVLANVDAISAPELIYPEAVYLHDGQSYLVRELDLQGRIAYVERRETDYYTQAILDSNVSVKHTRDERPCEHFRLGYADVDVRWKTVGFKKIKFNTRENIGYGSVDIPEQTLPTTALWLIPNDPVRQQMKLAGHRTSEGLAGLRNLAVVALPVLAMCDPRDTSGVVDSQNFTQSSMILYDRYPGGLGYCERGYHRLGELLELTLEIVLHCECVEGCPACVGLPNLRPAIHSDPDLSRGYPVPSKQATLELIALLMSRDPAELACTDAVRITR
jgi:DEAD/DEAH box helicase domain-containing protein